MASGLSVSKRTTTSVTFKIELSSAFNADNYIRVGVCNFSFTNGMSANAFIVNPAFNRNAWATTNFNNSTVVYLTVTGLTAGESYTFYGFAQAQNTCYYCVPASGDGLTVTTLSDASSDIPEGLICVKRSQEEDVDYCDLTFYVTLPASADGVYFDIYFDEECTNEYASRLYTTDDKLKLVTGSTYSFVERNIDCANTYYIRASSRIPKGNSVYGRSDWCSLEQISTPPSRTIFDDEMFSMKYLTTSDYLTLRAEKEINNYSFSRVLFTIYRDGSPEYLTQIYISPETTDCHKKSHTVYSGGFSTTGRTGVRITNPSTGTYLGIARVFYDTGTSALQPVDENGDEMCFMCTIDIEESKVRPGYFEWTAEKLSGKEYNLTAEEWTRLTENINEILAYKGLDSMIFTEPIQNVTTASADIFNEVINAILSIGYVLNSVNRGEIMYAQLFEDIKNKINSVE